MLHRCPGRMALSRAAAHLRRGGIVAYPTEGVWGLGCDPRQRRAFAKILALKKRPQRKGVILIAAKEQQTLRYWKKETDLALDPAQYWPGTTLVLPATSYCPRWIRGQHQGIALRVSSHPAVRRLCLAFGGPLVSTSANPAGKKPARSLTQFHRYFGRRILILSARLGGQRRPSRILDARTGQILRS
ncbi:MAG: Sua5/YciO/YrdC/YwlC family protein [Acidithiobacillus sp.]|nr:Sua5/YciO/YrdC/YwlC family protein [Acidithiobacillus sp.]